MPATEMPYSGNVATLPETHTENGRNYANDKETIDRLVLVAFVDGEFHEVVDARFYMGRSKGAQTVYCSVWVRSRARNLYFAGHGSAGGCGYHKASAAFQEAVDSAGIKLARPVDGCGESPMKHAMHAIATACGYGADVPRTVIG